jgi:hypothetical protein
MYDWTTLTYLHRVANLQKLWLQSNRIVRIEALGGVPRLRELWLQDNQIRDLGALSSLVELQVLALGANPIDDMQQLEALKPLSELFDLSFQDDFYGACPITAHDGYRNYMLMQLPSVAILDAVIVGDTERADVRRCTALR